MLSAVLLAAAVSAPAWGPGSQLKLCDDAAEWPPYTYFERVGGKPGKQLAGYSVEVLKQLSAQRGWTYQLDLLPWSRCLAAVKAGQYHGALNASRNPERERDYLFSRPYYATHSAYFFSRKVHPEAFVIKQAADLKRYKICGMQGYNYETYGLKSGELEQSSNRFADMLAKLHAGRCDLVLEKREVMQGFALVDAEMKALLGDQQFGIGAIPWVADNQFHMLLSRKAPAAGVLRAAIDAALNELEQKGELAKLQKQFVPQ